MKYEHWKEDGTDNPEACGGDLFTTAANIEAIKPDPKRNWELVGLEFCCNIEAESWVDAMTQYHKHMEWNDYVPMKEDA